MVDGELTPAAVRHMVDEAVDRASKAAAKAALDEFKASQGVAVRDNDRAPETHADPKMTALAAEVEALKAERKREADAAKAAADAKVTADAQKAALLTQLPISRTAAPEPSINGYLQADRTYSAGGRALNRASVRAY